MDLFKNMSLNPSLPEDLFISMLYFVWGTFTNCAKFGDPAINSDDVATFN